MRSSHIKSYSATWASLHVCPASHRSPADPSVRSLRGVNPRCMRQDERTAGNTPFRCTVNTTSLIQSRIERVAGECTSAAAKFIVTLRPTASPHRHPPAVSRSRRHQKSLSLTSVVGQAIDLRHTSTWMPSSRTFAVARAFVIYITPRSARASCARVRARSLSSSGAALPGPALLP